MSLSRRNFFRAAGLLSIGTLGQINWSNERVAYAQGDGIPADAALHVLNRVTWGARPEDLDRINQMGIEAFIDWQLDYENISDPKVDEFVAARRILSMEYDELNRIASDNYELVLETVLWNRVYRAIYSERQLYELLVEFWTDHFNVPIGDYIVDKTLDDRDVIRRHAFGKFRDLLFASAQSPAMLYYLDNAASNAEHPNENYARELMELHTLGVDGGYTEGDVVEVARALTGWTVNDSFPGRFAFDINNHDTDEKTVLGHTLPAGRGIEDGLQVLDILARHPSTARFIAFKLCRRFVNDRPPDALVESAAQVFTNSDGDIREVIRHILTSADFMASAGQKFRRPLDYLVAMFRVLTPGAVIEDASTVVYGLEPMGQLPYFWNPPNGYPDAAGAWINTNALLYRWNAALLLALAGDGYLDGVVLNIDQIVPPDLSATVGSMVDSAAKRILGVSLPPADHDQFIACISRDADPNQSVDADLRASKLPGLVGLLMASPYFQWH